MPKRRPCACALWNTLLRRFLERDGSQKQKEESFDDKVAKMITSKSPTNSLNAKILTAPHRVIYPGQWNLFCPVFTESMC
eukprot:3130090-Amphidinium_carterae.2